MDLVYDDLGNRARVARLSDRGVHVWGPERVYVAEDVKLDRICAGATLMNALITGDRTFIDSGAHIGTSGLARLHDAQIGPGVVLAAGTYESCALLAGVKTRGFAELRPGTVLEEQSEIGQNVGLKNTVFTVGVVAGSLINYCDVLLTGGSSRRDHSEVGSGAVHFNFDPRGDKFGSLMGDASGCLLRSRRIFVGGTSGIVAPVHLNFGAVIAAGSTIRKDVAENQMSFGESFGQSGDYDPDRYSDLSRKFCNTAKLVGTLHALRAWYNMVRLRCADLGHQLLYTAADQELERHIRHRVNELLKVIGKLETSLSRPTPGSGGASYSEQHRKLIASCNHIQSIFVMNEFLPCPINLLSEYETLRNEGDHVYAVRSLTERSSVEAANWLLQIASRPYLEMRALFGLPK